MGEPQALPQEKMEVPHSTFTLAKPDRRGRTFPQAIAHRGYKAANPENTMGAFRGAVEIGAHAIETDLHITRDGVLVISHDPSLKRCFGKDAKVIDCDWSYISTLRTVQAPHEPMPRLTDLLEYLTTPGLEDIWILLDIKLDNDADQLMSLIASSINEVKPTRPWNQRILLGCWAAKYVPLCATYLPDFPITHIGFSIGYAREFLSIPNVNFNMLRQILVGPGGSKFMADAKAAERSMLWVERENESDSSTVGGKEGNWRKGEESNYMLAIGTFEILAIGDETGRVKGVRVHENGTEEARREKKGLKNVSLDLFGTNKAIFDAGPSHDIYDQINESTQELKLDGLRTQSLPIKSKSKKPNVFGSLRKMIVRPKSEQDTAATGEHKSPTQGTVKSKLNRFNTITGGFRGGKKSEDMGEESSLSASADDRRVDDATGYEYLTPKEFLDLHFQGVVAGSSGTEIAMSNAVSAPIEIPQKRQDNASQKWTAERRAGEYMSEISRNPFADNPAVADPYIKDSTISDFENSYQEEAPERWSHDTHSSGPGRMSRGTEFSQSDEERMDIITDEIDRDTINLTPDNIDDVLAVWKRGFGTSSPSSPTHIPPRPHALSHLVHSLSTEALPITTPFRSQGSSLDVAGYSVILPNAQGDENRIAGAQWTPENDSEKVTSANSQRVMDFVESPRCLDVPQRNNMMKEHLREFALHKRSNTSDARCHQDTSEEPPPHGFSFPKRSNTGNLPHSRHPLANELTQNNTLSSIHQAPTKTQPLLPNLQEPTQETIAGTRYSSLPSSTTILSPPRKGKPSEQGRESPRIWNRKGAPASKPEPRTNLPVPERTIDRISTMTTISQFIPSRNGDLDEEITTNLISPKTSTKVSRRRIGSSNVQHPIQNHASAIPDVPAIPKTYAKHVTVLPKIGRDATGRFSVEHIKEEEQGIVRSSMDKEVPGEVSREELIEGPIDVYANHTIGTWDAVLRNSPGDVSPLDSDEGLNKLVSPVSPLEGNASGKSWDGEKGQNLYKNRNGKSAGDGGEEETERADGRGVSEGG
ncbi:putative glycerophosphoryl diester phosphodiesterase protein [Botrytis cinerea BcDW1]|uniref:Putative glycerophosphoryl diester phosphodiesterase protein n=1 Tax=Botryotinia fuckeliana (strain BcDW1) TaxID=1290391 RepID=M7UYZ4_BOTF1|nr:putative glycerophosphoryl diester phosphodiesterase protein [Botrytis cinerea BcDW1]